MYDDDDLAGCVAVWLIVVFVTVIRIAPFLLVGALIYFILKWEGVL